MEVDLSRPPAPLPPRVPIWVSLGLMYAAALAIYIVANGLLSEPASLSVAEGLFTVSIAASAFMIYAQLRLVPTTQGFSAAGGVDGPADGAPLAEGRLADAQEREARKNLRRGRITRREYERIIAHRRFAHGEISRPEYHEILRQLGYGPPGEGTVRSPAGGPP
jgi:hypothetical protein